MMLIWARYKAVVAYHSVAFCLLVLGGCKTFSFSRTAGEVAENVVAGQSASNWTFFVVAVMLGGFGAWSIWSKRFFEGALLIGGAVLVAAAPFVLADLLTKFDLPLKVGAWATLVIGVAIVVSRQVERCMGKRDLIRQAKAIRSNHPEAATALIAAAQPKRYLKSARAKENRKALAASMANT